jgi:hypothetical protein
MALRVVLQGIIFLAAAAFGLPDAFASGQRLALVIGNSAYQHTPFLKNPRNDASDLAVTLEKLGFTVITGLDLDKPAMDRRIQEFAASLHEAEAGVFFYAGHGLQVNGVNYLVPTDAELSTAAALDFEMVRLDLVQRTMERETNTNILFLDACRDNPLTRNLARSMGTRSAEIGHGLAAVESGVGTLISFSTQPGNVSFDGAGRNSPFTASLLRRLATPGEDLSSLLIGIRNEVMASTHNQQVPWEHSALRARFYFVEPPPAAHATTTASSDAISREAPHVTATVPANSAPAAFAATPPGASGKSVAQLWQAAPAANRPDGSPSPPANATPIAQKSASADRGAPVPIEPGEVVRGRLAVDKSHFWQIKASPGRYRLVFDVKRADDANSSLSGKVSAVAPDGRELGQLMNLSEMDVRRRQGGTIDTTAKPYADMVLRVSDAPAIVDYWLGLFPLDANVAFPYFSRTPKVEPLELGRSVSTVLTSNPDGAWYSIDFDAQDYRISAEFTRSDGATGSVGGTVDMFGPLGETGRGSNTVCSVGEYQVSARCARKLVFSEKTSVLFRVRPSSDASSKSIFKVEALASD